MTETKTLLLTNFDVSNSVSLSLLNSDDPIDVRVFLLDDSQQCLGRFFELS